MSETSRQVFIPWTWPNRSTGFRTPVQDAWGDPVDGTTAEGPGAILDGIRGREHPKFPRSAAVGLRAAPIGVVVDVAGSGGLIALDLHRLEECMRRRRSHRGLSGQVGSQIKVRVGRGWLLGSVRNQRRDGKVDAARWRTSISGRGRGRPQDRAHHGFRRG
jgi:hypothetical protein